MTDVLKPVIDDGDQKRLALRTAQKLGDSSKKCERPLTHGTFRSSRDDFQIEVNFL
jgi:hypothetical protein